MKLSHDLKNINIHLVNFFFLMSFLITRQPSRIEIDMGPISKLRVTDVQKLVHVYLTNTKVGYQITFFSFAKQIFFLVIFMFF